jgi:hypothetical protein
LRFIDPALIDEQVEVGHRSLGNGRIRRMNHRRPLE